MYRDFLTAARTLATQPSPSQGEYRRAVSSAYYAMFHAVCEMCANALHSAQTTNPCQRAWHQTYRALKHGEAVDRCNKCANDKGKKYSFPKNIQDFADAFVTMQGHRHDADYKPNIPPYTQAKVLGLIDNAEIAIEKLKKAPRKHKEAFASLILFPPPRS